MKPLSSWQPAPCGPARVRGVVGSAAPRLTLKVGVGSLTDREPAAALAQEGDREVRVSSVPVSVTGHRDASTLLLPALDLSAFRALPPLVANSPCSANSAIFSIRRESSEPSEFSDFPPNFFTIVYMNTTKQNQNNHPHPHLRGHSRRPPSCSSCQSLKQHWKQSYPSRLNRVGRHLWA